MISVLQAETLTGINCTVLLSKCTCARTAILLHGLCVHEHDPKYLSMITVYLSIITVYLSMSHVYLNMIIVYFSMIAVYFSMVHLYLSASICT